MNVLPTTAALAIKNVDVVQTCSWCHEFLEDAGHVLFTCNFAKVLWNLVGLSRIIPDGEGVQVMQVLKQVFITSTKAQCIQIGLLCWGLWVRRNHWVWDKKDYVSFWRECNGEKSVSGLEENAGRGK